MEPDNPYTHDNSVWSFKPHNGKTVIYVVRVNDYWPELCELTVQNLQYYAEKIGADLIEITERKYPDFPPTYEKLQIHELGRDNAWNILVDADFLFHPLAPDCTKLFPPDTVGFISGYDAHAFLNTRDKYFLRDGRDRGVATGFLVVNNLCHDIWTPLEFGWEKAQKCTRRPHIIDEFCISRNLARFGLKYIGVLQEQPDLQEEYYVHLGAEEKTSEERDKIVIRARRLMEEWGQL